MARTRHHPWSTAAGLLTVLLASGFPALAAPASYTTAIMPIMPATEIQRRWEPLIEALQQETGLSLQLRYYDGTDNFETGLAAVEPDIIVAGPEQIWRFRDKYLPIVRGDTPVNGVLVVPATSKAHELADLSGQRLAIPEGSDLVVRDTVLGALGDAHVNYKAVTTHTVSNAFWEVRMGKADAAVANSVSLRLLEPEIRNSLRVIYQTSPLPPPALAVRRSMPPEYIKALHDTLLKLAATKPALITNALMSNLVEADLDKDYGSLARSPAPEAAPHGP